MAANAKVVTKLRKPSAEFGDAFDAELEDAVPEDFKPEVKKKPELHAYIPPASYAKRYIHRKLHGIHDFDLMDVCAKNGVNLLLRGDTGAGKTMMPMAYAAERGIPYYSVPCDVAIDTTSLFGKMMPGEHVGEFVWQDGPVTELVRHGGILNISEVNFMPPKISASLFQLMDHRRSLTLLQHRGEVVRAHKKLIIVADMNPKYRGTIELNAAFANRFPLTVDWDYDPAVESQLINSPALLGLVYSIRKLNDIQTPVSTNSMEDFLKFAPLLGFDFAVENFIAKFAPSERDGVKKAFQAAEMNLKRELASLKAGSTPEDDMEAMDEDEEWFREDGDPDDFEWEDDE